MRLAQALLVHINVDTGHPGHREHPPIDRQPSGDRLQHRTRGDPGTVELKAEFRTRRWGSLHHRRNRRVLHRLDKANLPGFLLNIIHAVADQNPHAVLAISNSGNQFLELEPRPLGHRNCRVGLADIGPRQRQFGLANFRFVDIDGDVRNAHRTDRPADHANRPILGQPGFVAEEMDLPACIRASPFGHPRCRPARIAAHSALGSDVRCRRQPRLRRVPPNLGRPHHCTRIGCFCPPRVSRFGLRQLLQCAGSHMFQRHSDGVGTAVQADRLNPDRRQALRLRGRHAGGQYKARPASVAVGRIDLGDIVTPPANPRGRQALVITCERLHRHHGRRRDGPSLDHQVAVAVQRGTLDIQHDRRAHVGIPASRHRWPGHDRHPLGSLRIDIQLKHLVIAGAVGGMGANHEPERRSGRLRRPRQADLVRVLRRRFVTSQYRNNRALRRRILHPCHRLVVHQDLDRFDRNG